jgi:hypothetical protein
LILYFEFDLCESDMKMSLRKKVMSFTIKRAKKKKLFHISRIKKSKKQAR